MHRKEHRQNGVQATVEVNRNILCSLNSFCLKTGIAVDYTKALQYHLNPNPLSICLVDGRNRSNKKSDFKDVVLKPVKNLTLEELRVCAVQWLSWI